MNRKKWTVILLVLVLVAFGIAVGMKVLPGAIRMMRISELLDSLMDAENLSMEVLVTVSEEEQLIALESSITIVEEQDKRYLRLDQNGFSFYVWENLLFLENGKAFKIGEKLQIQMESCSKLLPYIGVSYEGVEICEEKIEAGRIYEISVTGDRVEQLMSALSLKTQIPADTMEELKLRLVEKNGNLEYVMIRGTGTKGVELEAILSEFQILSSGENLIPEVVKTKAEAVNADTLFSLSEDLYRLVLALAPLSDPEKVDGTVNLALDCGPVQLDTAMSFSDLKKYTGTLLDRDQLLRLPEMLGWLCMEGEIRCVQMDDDWEYRLELGLESMKDLTSMISPGLSQYGSNLTEGSIRILLRDGIVQSMELSVEGQINALITQIPIAIGVEFVF